MLLLSFLAVPGWPWRCWLSAANSGWSKSWVPGHASVNLVCPGHSSWFLREHCNFVYGHTSVCSPTQRERERAREGGSARWRAFNERYIVTISRCIYIYIHYTYMPVYRICIYVYLYPKTHTHRYIYIYAHTHTYIYIHMFMHIYIYIHTQPCTHTQQCTHTHIFICLYTYMNMCI